MPLKIEVVTPRANIVQTACKGVNASQNRGGNTPAAKYIPIIFGVNASQNRGGNTQVIQPYVRLIGVNASQNRGGNTLPMGKPR